MFGVSGEGGSLCWTGGRQVVRGRCYASISGRGVTCVPRTLVLALSGQGLGQMGVY